MLNRDKTLVGQGGIMLSNGQKAKIGLARNIYADADIYFFDDCFSSIDPKIALEIYEDTFYNLLESKTIILSTQYFDFEPDFDEVIVLEDGEIVKHGDFNSIKEVLEEKQFIQSKNNNCSNDKILRMQLNSLKNYKKNLKKNKRISIGSRSNRESISSVGNYEEWDFKSDSKRLISTDYNEENDNDEDARTSAKTYLAYIGNSGFKYLPIFLLSAFMGTEILSVFFIKTMGLLRKNEDETGVIFIHCIYIASSIFVLKFLSELITVYYILDTNSRIHIKMITSILNSPVSYLENNQPAKLMNRFSTDLGIMDGKLLFSFKNYFVKNKNREFLNKFFYFVLINKLLKAFLIFLKEIKKYLFFNFFFSFNYIKECFLLQLLLYLKDFLILEQF